MLAALYAMSAVAAPGAPPASIRACPSSHPVKGNRTTYDGSPCIAHRPDGRSYAKTHPERCYATMADAVADGCRPVLR